MIIVPANPNSIHVGMVTTGCMKNEFNLNFPTRLNGVISQNEFRESISNINSKIGVRKSQIVVLVIFLICIIGGMALVIAGAVRRTNSGDSSNIILFGVGAGMIGCSSLVFTIGWIVIRTRRTTKMRQAIAEESRKYSTRSPKACTWRLNVTRLWTRGYGRHHRAVFIYHVIIDIRHIVAPNGSARLHQNQVAPRPTSTIRSQNETLPPPYPGYPAAFCSQCGLPRPDPTAKFCPSCGRPFNSY